MSDTCPGSGQRPVRLRHLSLYVCPECPRWAVDDDVFPIPDVPDHPGLLDQHDDKETE